MLESWKTVPTVAENWRLQERHLSNLVTMFLVLDLRLMRYGLSAPHLGQIGLLGQRIDCRNPLQSSSVQRFTWSQVTFCRSGTGGPPAESAMGAV
jgi:hypothetical protein